MDIKYTDQGELAFNFHDALDVLMRKQPEICEAIACNEAVIDFVAQQIINKWTENYFHGPAGMAVETEYRGLGKAWRDVAKASGDIAKREIERLEQSLAFSQKQYQDLLRETARIRERQRLPY